MSETAPHFRHRTQPCFSLILAAALVLAAGTSLLEARTPAVLDFALRQVWPEVRVEMESFLWEGASSVRLEGVKLRERSTGTVMATMGSARISWSYGDLLQRKIGEISVDEFSIHIDSRLLGLLPGGGTPPGPKSSRGTTNSPGWSVARFHCRYGEFVIDDPLLAPVAMRALFTFDWQDFGTTEDLRSRRHQIALWNLWAGRAPGGMPVVASIDLAEVEISPEQLFEERIIGKITAKGGDVRAGAELREILQTPATTSDPAPASPVILPPAGDASQPWVLAEFLLENVRVELTSDFPGIGPGFSFTLNTSFARIPLGSLTSELGNEEQKIELANIEILSPIDPLVRVLTIHSIFAYFTINGILDSKIQRVVLLSPTIYLSQDLFFYMQEMRNEADPSGPPGEAGKPSPAASESVRTDAGNGWIIEQLRIEFGRLVLGGERMGQIGLPMSFQTSASNVRFDDLASLRLEAVLQVEPQSFAFPGLQLDLEKLRGELRFAYPPDRSPDNLVNELYLDGLRWRQFEGRDLWLATTFDATGVFASFGGQAYGGYINAGLSFFFGEDSRWLGWVTGTGIDLAQLSAVLAPKNVTLTGVADVRVEVDASASRIDRVRGSLDAQKPGTLTIAKLDEFIDDLPAEWSELKRSGAKIALETLRDFRYSRADADFWFVENQGRFDLRLPGPDGSRNFSLFLHADSTPDGRWRLDNAQR